MTTVKLKNIVKLKKGKKVEDFGTVFVRNSRRYIQIDDLRNDLNLKYTTSEGVQVKETDVLIAWDGANAGTVGYGLSGLAGSTITCLEIQNIEFESEYVGEFLKSKFDFIRAHCTGATIPHVSPDYLLNLSIPYKSLEDQKQIIKSLDAADSLRQKRKKQIALLDDYLKSVFVDMFGDPVRNDKKWEYRKLPQLISKAKNSLKRGPFGGALKKEIFVDDGYLVYEQNHALKNDYSFKRYFVDEKIFNALRAFEVKSGDILISCSGVYLGKLSIVPEGALPGIINQALLKVTLNSKVMLQIFFVYLFSNATFKEKYISSNRGSGIPNLPPMSIMKEIDFIAPPMELQKKFASIVEQVEQTRQKMCVSLDEMDNHFNVLMQRYFG